MYVLRLVNIQDHTPWMATFQDIGNLLANYGSSSYQERMWQAEVWAMPDQEMERNGRNGIVITMQNGRWRMTANGERHFTGEGIWPNLPPDRR